LVLKAGWLRLLAGWDAWLELTAIWAL